jgi:hypothetical protein
MNPRLKTKRTFERPSKEDSVISSPLKFFKVKSGAGVFRATLGMAYLPDLAFRRSAA